MTTLRRLTSAALSRGVLSAGWYSILTGLALLVVGSALASVSRDDPAAGGVGVVFVLAGVWQLERGLRSEFQRRRTPGDTEL
jgi:hypothetical protein